LRNTPQNLGAWVLEPQRFETQRLRPASPNRKHSTSRPGPPAV
jgi:hypothetical protein